jgi:Divergent InlB B-repeat domain/HYDIN/CFA65/VesB-like, Ig-like domain
MKRANQRLTLIFAGTLAILALGQRAAAQPTTGYLVTINTSSLNGDTGNVDLQFNAGALTSENACVNISYFSGATLGGSATTTGSVTGTLATSVTINNGPSGCNTPAVSYTSSTVNDYNQPVTFGNQITFFVTFSGPGVTNPNSSTYNSGSSFGVALIQGGNPALTGDPSNFAGTITLNPDGTQTASALPGPGNTTSLVTIQQAELVTVGTSPSGLSFSIDSTSYTSSQTLPLAIGSAHTLTTTSPQPGTTGTEYAFSQWSDGTTTTTDNIMVSTGTTTYTAQFTTEYLLTTKANPTADGSVSVNTTSPTGDSYYPSGTQVSIMANPNTGYKFTSWTGNVANTTSASTTVTMSAPETVTANFGTNNVSVTVGTSPTGLSFTVDSHVYTTTQTFAWQVGSNHNVSTNSPQGLSGNEYTFSSWTGGNNPTNTSESITVSAAATYTADFNVMSVLAFSPTSLYFTARDVGTTSPPQTVTVTNKGSNPVTINSVTPSISDYIVSNNGCTTIAGSGGSCQVQVEFKPTTYGSRPGSLSFNDAGYSNPQSIGLGGTGIGILLSPSSLTFPSQHGNTKSATQTLTLTNFLSTTLSYGAPSFSGANPGDFPIQSGGTCSTSGGILAANGSPGSTCTYLVAFEPTANGSEGATLSVTAAGPQTANANLIGTGVGALLPPPTGYFPSQLGNTTSPTSITLTFYNYLSSSLSYTPTMTGPNGGDFIVQSTSTCANSGGAPTASSLAGNSSCTFVFKFHPTVNGSESGTLSISDADGTQTSTLTGTGVGAQLAPSSYSYGTYPKGQTSAAKSFTLTNYLTTSLSITGNSFTGTNEADFHVSGGTCPATSGSLAGSTSCTYNIVFKPSTTSSETATFTVTDGDGSQSTALTGSGH